MMIKLTNEQLGLTVYFMEDADISRIFGYHNLYGECYNEFVRKNNIFKMNSTTGFLENHAPVNYTVTGINEDGVSFKANSFEAKAISWAFKNVFTANQNKLSPNQLLQLTLENKNGTIRVDVETSNHYHQEFYLSENTTLEGGVIELITANTGGGIDWIADDLIAKFYCYELGGEAMLPTTLPDILLNDIVYPWHFNVLSAIVSNPIITFKMTTGEDRLQRLEHVNTGEFLEYQNTDLDTLININCKDFTVTNQSGEDRSANFTGDWLALVPGVNNFIWTIDSEPLQLPYPNYISQTDYCEFTYDNVVGSIA